MSSLNDFVDRVSPGPGMVLLFGTIAAVYLLYLVESRQRETNQLLRHQVGENRRLARRLQTDMTEVEVDDGVEIELTDGDGDDEWTCDGCGQDFDSQQALAGHQPCPAEEAVEGEGN